MKQIYGKEEVVCVQVHKEGQKRNLAPPLSEELFLTCTTDKEVMVTKLREAITSIKKDKYTKFVEEVRKKGRVLSFWVLDKEDGNFNFIGNYST